MRVGFFANTLVAGLLVLFVWIYDFHYKPRISKKLPSSVLEGYRALSLSVSSNPLYTHPKGLDLDDFYYVHNDTVYLELYNYLGLNATASLTVAKTIEAAYANQFTGIHACKVYVKLRRLKRDAEVPMDEASPFQDSHLRTTNLYYIRLLNSDMNDQIHVKGNVVAMNLPTEKLLDRAFVESLVGKALYHLKKLGKLRSVTFSGLPDSATLIEKLRRAYLVVLADELSKHVDGLTYINQNRNLVFIDRYRAELETELDALRADFEAGLVDRIGLKLDKKDIAIYETVYMFEEY